MIVKAQKLNLLLEKHNLTRQQFADKLGVAASEVDKMLEGITVGYDTSRKFIYYFKATRAQHLIDWDNLGVENPLLKCDVENYTEDDK